MESNMRNENNLNIEIINNLAIKIANLEIQVAALAAENKILQQNQNSIEAGLEAKKDEPST